MKHAPITKQRSQWLPVHTSGTDGIYQRRVNDGELVAIAADEPGIGWHLSISFRDHRGKLSRYPRWDEIMHARDHLLPSDVGFVMHLPADGDVSGLMEFIGDMMILDPKSKISVELHANSNDQTRSFNIVGIEARLCSFEPDTFIICIEED